MLVLVFFDGNYDKHVQENCQRTSNAVDASDDAVQNKANLRSVDSVASLSAVG